MLDVGSPAPGVHRFTVPLAMPSPDHLNIHVLDTPDGPVLVDCGAVGSESGLRAGLDALGAHPDRLLITHAHLDHWGLATTIADRVLAHPGVLETFVLIGGGSVAQGSAGSASPAPMTDAFAGFLDLMAGIPEVDPIQDGDRIGDWEVLWTPGHDPGHVCLYRATDGVLLCGDLLLPGFTPNVQPSPNGSDALADFLGSLERVGSLPVSLVLPAHGEPYSDASGRAAELMAHHAERLDTLLAALRGGTRSLRDLRDATFSVRNRPRADRMLAAMETYAHLDHLRNQGRAHLRPDGQWAPAGPGGTSP
jgi:glyoxylase-like metal-dependent hydrolase (beta-lactamase superfamily II)